MTLISNIKYKNDIAEPNRFELNKVTKEKLKFNLATKEVNINGFSSKNMIFFLRTLNN